MEARDAGGARQRDLPARSFAGDVVVDGVPPPSAARAVQEAAAVISSSEEAPEVGPAKAATAEQAATPGVLEL